MTPTSAFPSEGPSGGPGGPAPAVPPVRSLGSLFYEGTSPQGPRASAPTSEGPTPGPHHPNRRTHTTMNTTQFNEAADALTKALAVLVLIPLDDMTTYIEDVEDSASPDQAKQIAYVARCIAATIHLRTTVLAGVDR